MNSTLWQKSNGVTDGRFQDLKESKEIDEEIKQKLIVNEIQFIEFDVHTNTAVDIFNYINKNYI